ncbi:amidohydrolase family protein [Yinghuangia seranimata]|uniref:amidohydrolase family protein n=1 Tax=Yinghuangia seranimata TaxID=408067 RepID=UPI00248B9094|nr:amidohydrolase family protein [Yinghuangia seranimata]MDI2129736.1 amidohydrolase family protein [Yinghuangia seranimata]
MTDPNPLVDTHVHVVSPDTVRYPRTGGTGDGADYWSDGSATAEHVLAVQAAAGVGSCVLVQGVGAYGYDCRYVLDAAAAHPGRTRAVVAVDPTDPAGPERLAALLADHPARDAVCGVRLFAVSGGPGRPVPEWFHAPHTGRLLDVAAEARVTLVLTTFACHLPTFAPLLAERPTLDVALDHAGFPDPTAGPAGLAPVLALAELPGVRVKISTHLFATCAPDDPADVVDTLAEAFGDERLLWGSDHPQTRTPDYAGKVALAEHAVRRRGAAARAAVLGGNARALWWA